MENWGPLFASRAMLSLGPSGSSLGLLLDSWLSLLLGISQSGWPWPLVSWLCLQSLAWPEAFSQKCLSDPLGGFLQCRPCALSFKVLSVQGGHKQKWILKTQTHIFQGNDSGMWAWRGIRAEVTFWNDVLVLVPAWSWTMDPFLAFQHILKRRKWSS